MTINESISDKKEATVMYATLSGFSALSDVMEPGDLNKLVNQCNGIIESVVSLWEGTSARFVGDSFLAAFCDEDENSNCIFKATGAALDIVEKVSGLTANEELNRPINVKIGLKTGPVFISTSGGDGSSPTIIGEPITFAKRLSDIAENMQVLAGSETFEKIRKKYDCQVLEPVPVKGMKKPLPVYLVKGKKRPKSPAGVSSFRMIEAEMIGRKQELQIAEKQIMQLINGRGSILNITGGAGIGKSRLIAEMMDKEIVKRVALFKGRAVSNGKNLSFHPIIQIIKSWAGIKEEDAPVDAIAKLQRNIQRVHPEAYNEIFPFIATMMGYNLEGKAKERMEGIEGEALENLILKNLRDLLARAASIRPVIILIEDAHWCDVSSIIFLESLFKLSRKHRILFVNIFRPGYKQTGDRIRRFLKDNLNDIAAEIIIEPLSEELSSELINNLLNNTDLPDEIKALVIERSAGNPFYLEEVIRSFIDDGYIEIKEDRFLINENIRFATIPESIDNVLLSRIDRLDDNTKDLLKTASVIGRNFYYKILEDAAQNIEEIDNRLEFLKDVQLVNERRQRNEVEFLFKHALAQQAAYESIVENSKKELHLKIARSIEKVFAGRIHEFYGTLAHHFGKAGQQEKTMEYLVKAGDESQKSGASSEAVTFFKQALEYITKKNNKQDRQYVLDLEEKLAHNLAIIGKYTESIEYCDRIIARYYKPFPRSNFRRLIELVISVLLLYRIIYFFKSTTDESKKGIDYKLLKVIIIQSHSFSCIDTRRLFFDSPVATRFVKRKQFGNYEATAIMLLGSAFFHTGILFNLGKKLVDWGEKFSDENYKMGWIRVKFCVAMRDYEIGKKADVADEKKVLEYGIQTGDFFYTANYFYYESFSIIENGNEKLTHHLMNRVIQITEAFDCAYSQSLYHRINITYNLKFRRLDKVINIADEAVDFLIKNDFPYILLPLYAFRSMACTFREEFSEAEKYLSRAEQIVKSLRILTLINIYFIAKCHLEIAKFQKNPSRDRDVESILKSTRKCTKLAQKVKKNLPEAYRMRANVFWLIGKPGKALRNFEKSIKAGLDYDCKLELSRTFFEAGKFLSDPKNKKERINGINATECLLKAKSMFEEMNLEWDLKEYKKYMEGDGRRSMNQLS